MFLYLLLAIMSVQENRLTVTSTEFESEGRIPVRYTCDGKDINPPLTIEGIPQDAKSLVVIMEDPDLQSSGLNYWTVWNLPVTSLIEEGTREGVRGRNSVGKTNYQGPCPAAGSHRYVYQVYALDSMLNLPEDSDEWSVRAALKDHVLASGELMGWYRRR